MENLEQPTENVDSIESNNNVSDEMSEEQLVEQIRQEAETLKQTPEVVEEETKSTEEQVVEEPTEEATDSIPKEFEQPIVLTSRGLKIEVKSMDELIQLANGGLDYTRKMQQLTPHKKTIEYIEQQGITADDLHLLADIKAGNKQAIARIAKQNSVDVYDLDTDAEYSPKAPPVPLYNEVEEVAQEILQNSTLSEKMKSLVQYVPDEFKQILSKDAGSLRGFAKDVSNGVADRVIPEAIKIHALNPRVSFLDAYGAAYGRLYPAEQPQAQPQVVPTPSREQRAKAAVNSQGQSVNRSSPSVDIWEDGISDAELVSRIQQAANKLRSI